MRERRNIRADYRRAFGEVPPPVNGIHIITDTDDTRGSTTAYYGDIVARSSPSVRNDDLDRSDLGNGPGPKGLGDLRFRESVLM